ncbi:hypothetical protein VQ056_31695 [Paenibacillus sp. JTLBN-2024]
MKKAVRYAALFILLLAGCQDEEGPPLKDEAAVPDIPAAEMKDGYIIYHHRYDNMDRGHHDFEARTVIDPNYYEQHPFKRGEIVYFQPRTSIMPNTRGLRLKHGAFRESWPCREKRSKSNRGKYTSTSAVSSPFTEEPTGWAPILKG